MDASDPVAGRPTNIEPDVSAFEISSFQFSWRVAIWLAMLVGGMAIAAQSGIGWFIAGAVLTGLGIAHGVELSHQALHNTGFRSPRLNEIFGVAMGLPMLVSFYEYRLSHLKHHAKVGTPEDTEFFDYGEDMSPTRMLIERFMMVRHYGGYGAKLVRALRGAAIGDFADKHQPKLRLFYKISLAALLALIGLCMAIGSVAPLVFWLVANFCVATPVHALIEFPEHHGCDRHSRDVLRNTRTLTSNRLMRWFTNSNNFHVEHHYFPRMPLQNAHKVHAQFRPHIQNLSAGYRSFYLGVLRDSGRSSEVTPE